MYYWIISNECVTMPRFIGGIDITLYFVFICFSLCLASDKVYQLLARGRWFSPSTPVSSTTNTVRHDIAEILLKVALNTKNLIKSNLCFCICVYNDIAEIFLKVA